jgi:hypothetical protein
MEANRILKKGKSENKQTEDLIIKEEDPVLPKSPAVAAKSSFTVTSNPNPKVASAAASKRVSF